ncbi:alpha-amylase family glycosyl hydrolase [Pedosphaera parvula]|uniref:1,4-alpha-glucan branching enzyme n=1 Tax=Pedosphaera parvula (strain Ellin514) TaxID=320771 RepID=B9XCV6_PEDPL|nr:alpha-amylase family glycosyl hydrolase [Pedosphaera parvula]EEF62302.1 alpha amylase all-beta [Pedosphaera parvula Ellin514]
MTTPQPDLSKVPMGGSLVPGGAAFRIWAPRAKAVWVSGDFNGWKQQDDCLLDRIGGGHWAGFFPALKESDQYLFYIDGNASTGYKRDPVARQLTFQPAFPNCNCVLRDPFRFPWHQNGFRPPAFNELIVYELHVGAFSQEAGHLHGKFLDLIKRIPYLSDLGVNAIELMPVQEYPSIFSLGYNGTDYYSPENDYGEADESQLQGYFNSVNQVLQQRGQAGYTGIDILRGPDNQLRALIDVCHVYEIAVVLDVVFNHAGGGFDANSMWFEDRMPDGNKNDSLYFTDHDWAGGQVFAYWNNDVQQFLINNTKFFIEEYRVDGFRFDEFSVMDRNGGWNAGQAISGTLRAMKPEAITIAEYWPVNDSVVRAAESGGAGFDATWHDGIRLSVRAAISGASSGASAFVDMDAIARAVENPGLNARWRGVQSVEDHDVVRRDKDPRIPRLADDSNPRSWYGRSRSRVATGLLLTAPGIPMLFMGQEFLEDKQWNDDPSSGNQLWWFGLENGDKQMADFLRFTRELIGVRRRQPGLRGEGCRVIHSSNQNRVLIFQRWAEGIGRDVVVAVSLSENTWFGYQVGFPGNGHWLEVFNSDVYENWVNPGVYGNGSGVEASAGPQHGLGASAFITIPANGIVVFARDSGD